MDKNEIKKALYKDGGDIASFQKIKGGNAYYIAGTLIGEEVVQVNFVIPISDMGGAEFLSEMPAKNLARWIETE